MRSAILVAAMTFVAAPAAAQQPPQIDCAAPTITQMEMNTCAEQAWIAADADLNLAYRQALTEAQARDESMAVQGIVPPLGIEEGLRLAQRAWIPFRDAACAAEASLAEGGSMQPMLGTLCLERLTRRRTEDLLAFVWAPL